MSLSLFLQGFFTKSFRVLLRRNFAGPPRTSQGFVDTFRGLPYPGQCCGTTYQRGMHTGCVQAMPGRGLTECRGYDVPGLRSFPLNR